MAGFNFEGLGGLADAVTAGVQGYQNVKAQNAQLKREERRGLLDASEKGLEWDEAAGKYNPTAQRKQKEEAEKLKLQQQDAFKTRELDLREKDINQRGLMSPLDQKLKQAQINKLNREALSKKAGGVGKILPGGEVASLSEANSIVSQLDDLDKSFEGKSTAGMSPWKSLKRGGSKALGLLGIETDLGNELGSLEAKQDQNAQVVGRFLEGGKLAEGDIARYKKQLPQASDSDAVRRTKIDSLKKLVAQKQSDTARGFGEAGYNVDNIGLIGNEAQPQASHPQSDAALGWAKANPNDPRAKAIMQRIGGGGGVAR